MKPEYYNLVGKEAIPVPFELMRRPNKSKGEGIIKQETVGDWWISTVFIGFEHDPYDDGPPQIFETLVQGPDLRDNEYYYYATWAEAEEGHRLMVAEFRNRVCT